MDWCDERSVIDTSYDRYKDRKSNSSRRTSGGDVLGPFWGLDEFDAAAASEYLVYPPAVSDAHKRSLQKSGNLSVPENITRLWNTNSAPVIHSQPKSDNLNVLYNTIHHADRRPTRELSTESIPAEQNIQHNTDLFATYPSLQEFEKGTLFTINKDRTCRFISTILSPGVVQTCVTRTTAIRRDQLVHRVIANVANFL